MNSMKIGTYQMDTTFGLYLPEYTIPAPAVQTNFVKIIGRDGSVDLSNALGLHYDSRTWSLDFKCFDPTVNWHTLSSQVMNAIHGKRLNFEFDDDPNYFWTGRVSVQNYVSNHGTGTLKVTIVSDPCKYAKLSTIVTKTASTGTEYTGALVTFNTANAKINDLSVTMQPIQDLHGYANPWPAGGGKNLCYADASNLFPRGDGLTIVENAGAYTAYAKVSKNTDYVFSCATTPFRSSLFGFESEPAVGVISHSLSYTTPTTTSRAFNSGNYEWVGLYYGTPENPQTNVMIEAGTTPTTFAPYSNICPISGRTGLSVYVGPTQDQQDATTYAVDWTDEAGTVYHGTVDPVTGQLTVDRASVDMGTLNWFYGSSYGGYFNSQDIKNLVADTYECLSDRFKNMSMNSTAITNNDWAVGINCNGAGGAITGAAAIGAVVATCKQYTDAATFKTAMSGVQLCYELATPLTYQLTAQEVAALVGTNNVWSDGGNVTVAVVTPETLTNNGRAVVPTLTASADMVLKWGNYSASVQQGTSTIPQLILENGANLIYIIGTGSISFTWQEASL